MPATGVVPLFVLPMGLFPLTQEPLRVFEPRYKQMLDDCVLGGSAFGYVAAASPPEGLDGWSMPSEYGLLSTADDLTELVENYFLGGRQCPTPHSEPRPTPRPTTSPRPTPIVEVSAGSRSARLSSPISWALPSALVLVALRTKEL